MPFVTHFKSPAGEDLQIVAAELVTVEVPAVGSADLGDWHQGAGDAYYMQNTFTDAPANCAVLQSCTDPSAITNHGLRIEFDEQFQDWALWVDSLPETSCTLTLLFINHSTEDTPVVLPALGVGGGATNVLTFDSVEEMNAAQAPEGSLAVVPRRGCTVRIPAAGAADLYGWTATESGGYELLVSDVAWMKENLPLELKSDNAALITEHNLLLHQDDGFLDLTIDSLPERESVLHIVVPTMTNGGALNG